MNFINCYTAWVFVYVWGWFLSLSLPLFWQVYIIIMCVFYLLCYNFTHQRQIETSSVYYKCFLSLSLHGTWCEIKCQRWSQFSPSAYNPKKWTDASQIVFSLMQFCIIIIIMFCKHGLTFWRLQFEAYDVY